MERCNRSRTGGSGSLSKSQLALCGAMAGAFAGACTTPFDVIKTRIMLAEVSSIFMLTLPIVGTNNFFKPHSTW